MKLELGIKHASALRARESAECHNIEVQYMYICTYSGAAAWGEGRKGHDSGKQTEVVEKRKGSAL